MGYYIQGPVHHKAEFIMNDLGGKLMFDPVYLHGEFTTVCVVNNGAFDAAAIAYSLREFEAFNDPSDPRPQVWLQVPTAEVIQACPEVKEELAP